MQFWVDFWFLIPFAQIEVRHIKAQSYYKTRFTKQLTGHIFKSTNSINWLLIFISFCLNSALHRSFITFGSYQVCNYIGNIDNHTQHDDKDNYIVFSYIQRACYVTFSKFTGRWNCCGSKACFPSMKGQKNNNPIIKKIYQEMEGDKVKKVLLIHFMKVDVTKLLHCPNLRTCK